jgi:hypothetical protein
MSYRPYDSSRLPADALARSVRQTFLPSQDGNIDISSASLGPRLKASVTTLVGTTPIETNTDREDTIDTETLIPTLLEERRSLLVMKEHRTLCTARWHLRPLGISLTSPDEKGTVRNLSTIARRRLDAEYTGITRPQLEYPIYEALGQANRPRPRRSPTRDLDDGDAGRDEPTVTSWIPAVDIDYDVINESITLFMGHNTTVTRGKLANVRHTTPTL